MSRLACRVILLVVMVAMCGASALAQRQPCTQREPAPLSVPGYTLSEGGDVVERIAVHSVVRESDETEIGAIHLRKFLDDAPGFVVQAIIDEYTTGYVSIDGAAATPISVNDALWYRAANGMMDEWHRYNEALHAVIRYMQPVSRVSDEEAMDFLAAFDQRNRRYVPVLADFTPVPGYAFLEGDELFKSIGIYDVHRDCDGVDVGALNVYRFQANAPQEMKAFVIERQTRSRFGAECDSATWVHWQDGTNGKWHRYDRSLDAVLEYAYPLARVSDADARAFLEAFGGLAGADRAAASQQSRRHRR